MAERGKPLEWAKREEILRRLKEGERKAAIARALCVSRNTVAKYGKRV